MEWLKNVLRPEIMALQPYVSARAEAGGFEPSIAIDANESPWPPFGSLGALCHANRYPEPQPQNLRARLGAVWGVNADQVLIGRGSDDCIDLLLRLCCRAGQDSIIICPPTFGMYKVYAEVQGAAVIKIPLTQESQLDVPAIKAALRDTVKLIYIPSPNAPMGHAMRREDVLAVLDACRDKCLVVLDEAYVEFTTSPEGYVPDLKNYTNLVVLRTMSKAHALAGERIGALLAAPEIIRQAQKAQAAYPLTQSSIKAALDALSPNGLIESSERRRIIVAERERMARLLPQSPFIEKVYPSIANFLLVETPDAAAFMKRLQQYGILARSRHSDIPNTVRLSLGTPEENTLVLRALGVDVPDAPKQERIFSVHRATKETAIDVTVNLDNPAFVKIDTGVGFFDHMLMQLATHGGFGLALQCKGDLHIDQHHTIEDCALALGEALRSALGDKKGVARFGFQAPLDEALANVTLDLSGRPYAEFHGTLPAPTVGGMSSEMVPHFFHSLANTMLATLHITVTGDNAHHMVEACFKAVGRALRQAMRREGDALPSTKGVL